MPSDKRLRVRNFHHQTVVSVAEMVGAMGLHDSAELRPWHIMRRISPYEVKHYGEIFEYLNEGDLLDPVNLPATYKRAWLAATPDSFDHVQLERA